MIRFSSGLKGAHVTLSTNDTVATCTSSAVNESAICLPGTNPFTATKAQKLYVEFLITTGDGGVGSMAVGMCKDIDSNTWLGAPGRDSFGFWSDGTVYQNSTGILTIATWTTADRICVAWDNALALAWVRKNGGNWNGSGTANPATGTGGIQMDTGTANAIRNFAAEPGDSGTVGVITLKSRKADWLFTPPSGFHEVAAGILQYAAAAVTATATVTPALPYTITAGNRLVLATETPAYISAPSGFSAVPNASNQSGSGANEGFSFWDKQAVGGDTCSYTMSGSFNSVWLYVEMDGVDTTTPQNVAASSFVNNAGSNTAKSQAATPTGSADVISLVVIGTQDGNTGVNLSGPPTAVLDNFDLFQWIGHTVGFAGAGGETLALYGMVERQTAAGAAITGGCLPTSQNFSGSHFLGGLNSIYNVASSGGNVYNVTVSETGTLADTVTGVGVFPRSVAEAGTLADTLTGVGVFPRSVAETGVMTDIWSAGSFYIDSVAESGTLADTVTVAPIYVGQVNEAGTLAETQTSQAVFVSSVAEFGALVDTLSGNGTFNVLVSEGGVFFDSYTGTGGSPVDGGYMQNEFRTNFSFKIGPT